MSELETITAPKYWGRLVEENPIVALTGVVYTPRPHGTPSNNQTIVELEGMYLSDELNQGKWPYFGPIWCDRPGNELEPQTFAVGSLIYIWPGRQQQFPDEDIKLHAKYLNYEEGMSLQSLERFGIKPVAIVMLDFDCPNDNYNLQKIVTTLKESPYKSADWTVFKTDQSFHLVFKGFVSPKNVPWHWGRIVKTFAFQEKGWQREIFESIGDSLMKCYDDPQAIREICKYIRLKVRHPDDSVPEKIPFIIDLGWIYHSLLELTNYLETSEGSFGFIRISNKNGLGEPPKVAFTNSRESFPSK